MLIHYVSSLAAAGKTYEAIKFAVAGVRAGERFIICAPSTLLVDQIAKDCRNAGCARVTAIHNDDGEELSVVARLTKHFKTTDCNRGEIVVMTFAAMERIQYIEKRKDWHLIVDEVPTPIYHERFSLMDNRDHLLDLIQETHWNAAYSLLSASEADTGNVMHVGQNPYDDEITRYTSNFANKLLSRHWECFALNGQLANFRERQAAKNAIDMFGLLRPSIFGGFKSVTMMGACMEDSLVYRYWRSLGVLFEPHPVIKPRFIKYPNADLVTVQYAIDRNWSAKVRDTVINGKRVIDTVAERCLAAIGGEPFVYLVNKAEHQLAFENGKALPHLSHGLNEYQGFHNAMLLSALNPPPAYFGFCNEMMGLDSDEVQTAIYRGAIYQASMRISIRDLSNQDRKRIQVPDKISAIWLANLIGTDHIEKLPGNEIVPPDGRHVPTPKTNAEMILAHRQNRRTELIAELDEVNKTGERTSLYNIKESLSPAHVGSIFQDKYSIYASSTRGIAVTSFRNLLAEAHSKVVDEKTDRSLICPAVFNPDLAETWRGNENIVSMSGIWMDNDGGDLTPDEFAKMLKTPMCIFNSFNSTTNAPRWRVWIPTSHLITRNVHKELLAQLRKLMVRRGYYGKSYIAKHSDRRVKHHGFDEGKMAQAVLFYLPSQAKAGADASFFLEYHWNNDLLNPYEWVDRTIVDHRPPTIVKPAQAVSKALQPIGGTTTAQAKIEAANANWQSHQKGGGNAAFFRLAVAYKHAGLNWMDAEPLLRQQAQWAHPGSQVERLNDLRNYGRKVWRN